MRITITKLSLMAIIALLPMLLCVVSIADVPDVPNTLKKYRGYMDAWYDKTIVAADAVRLADDKMDELGDKYDATEGALAEKNNRIVASTYSVTKDVFAEGTLNVLSAVVSAFTSTSMSDEEKESILMTLAGTPLIDAYTSAIEEKKSALNIFDNSEQNTT